MIPFSCAASSLFSGGEKKISQTWPLSPVPYGRARALIIPHRLGAKISTLDDGVLKRFRDLTGPGVGESERQVKSQRSKVKSQKSKVFRVAKCAPIRTAVGTNRC